MASHYETAVSNASNDPVTVSLGYTWMEYPLSNDDLIGMPILRLGA